MADDNDNKTTTAKAKAPAPAPERRTTAEQLEAAKAKAADEREALETPADIAPAKATSFDASGSVMEPAVKAAIPVEHPAVDNNPRAGTTERQNQADFNDPTLSAEEAVKENLSKKS